MLNYLRTRPALIVVFICILCILHVRIFSQTVNPQLSNIYFDKLTSEDGLSYNKVQCILEDKQGFIWFGTVSGLNRYDGYTFKIFENIPGDSSTLPGNDIVSLYQDHESLIWIGTSISSFSSYNPHTGKLKNYYLPKLNVAVHDFKEDENGNIWLATGSGLFSFQQKNNKLVFHPTDDSARENIQGILEDKNNNVFWLSTETGIRKFNKKSGTVKTYHIPYPAFSDISQEITHNIIRDKYGDIWMSTSDHGVYCFNPNSEKFKQYPVNIIDPASAQSRVVTQLMDDHEKMWICGEGLAFLDQSTQSFSFYKMNAEDPKGIPGKIRALLKDKNGIYWLGTENGIARYDPKLKSFTTIKPNPPYTLQTAKTILEDKDHKFWVGNSLGLGSVDMRTGIYTNENNVLGTAQNNYIFCSILDKDGSMWFGSEGCLYHVYKRNGSKVSSSEKIVLPGTIKANVTALEQDPDGLLWTGTRKGGLFRYDPILKTFKQYKDEENDTDIFSETAIKVLHIINKDRLLIGTDGAGLILMDIKSGKNKKIKTNKNQNSIEADYTSINAICEDRNKNIWIAVENNGLWQTDTLLSVFKDYSLKDGLQSMNINSIIEDDVGQMWLNSNLGLEIIDPSKKRFVHYSEHDGLSINQPDYLFKKASGDIIRIDFKGFHIFHSSSVNLNKNMPPVYINYLQVLDKQIPIYNDTVIHLHHNQNYVSFDYVVLNYTQSFKNRYMYRLDGLDKTWIDAGSRRFVSYANIAPGTYVFEVNGCNNEGLWNEKPARVTLIISPPWWHEWWFYTLCAVFACGAIYFLFQYRLKQKLKAFELRNTISRDLHDEVGSTLSSIGFLSSMALNDVDSANTKAHKTLSSISESSHKMLDAMNDIIWSIQPQNDSLDNIIARMISFASELLEARKITLNYSMSNNLKNLHLGINVRHDFYVIFKEAVNNIAKYSEASTAWVSLEFRHPWLILTVSDNGKGFEPEQISRGNGLKNMPNRAKKMGAQYNLHSKPGKGTTITLQVKTL